LTDSLKSAGFVKPKDTVKEIESLEDEITEALEDKVTYYRKKASKAVDLKALKKL